MDLVLVTGAGASRELGVGGPMPLMADWSRKLIALLESRLPGVAQAIGLTPELDGQQFEEALGAWLKWRDTRDLRVQFAGFGGPSPGSLTQDAVAYRDREDERIQIVVTALNETLQDLFGRRAINDARAEQAYRVLFGSLKPDSLVGVTTNYDVALEIGITGTGREPDDGFVAASYGDTPVFTPAGMVERARAADRVPVLHVHGAVGWYAQGSVVRKMYADLPYNPTLGTPVVLYPDPDKDPTRDALVAELWVELARAIGKASHVLVIGHSLHDAPLTSELRRIGKKTGVVVFNGLDAAVVESEVTRVRALLPEAHIIPGTFGTDPQFSGAEYDAWKQGAPPRNPAYLRNTR